MVLAVTRSDRQKTACVAWGNFKSNTRLCRRSGNVFLLRSGFINCGMLRFLIFSGQSLNGRAGNGVRGWLVFRPLVGSEMIGYS